MTLILNSGPDLEVVSMQEMKAHLRIEHQDEDILIRGLITAARAHIEIKIERIMIKQNWSFFLDKWPKNNPYIKIPIAPLKNISNIYVHQTQTRKITIPKENINIDIPSNSVRIQVEKSAQYQIMRIINGIEIQFDVGYGENPQKVPQNLKLAIMQLAAHWYENRETVSMTGKPAQMPESTQAILQPYISKKLI